MSVDQGLPFLTFELAHEIKTFPSFVYTVSTADVHAYEQVTGDLNEIYRKHVPPGFAGVFGRTSYLQAHRMPPGGVLLGQDIVWHQPALVGVPLIIQAVLVDSDDNGGKRSLTFETTATQSGQLATTIRVKARWPQ